MAKPPQFTIFAGPNGAGKSTHGDLFVAPGTFIFNGDVVFANLVKRYPNIEPDRLGGGVAVQLEKDRDRSIENQTDFCFESNYSNQLAVDISEFFKAAGYELNLIYFGLPDFFDSLARVKDRVALGGHDVPVDIIAFNRNEGVRRVRENLHLYDQAIL